MTEIDIAQCAYLGDGVYLFNDGYYWILFTYDGCIITNKIYLDDRTRNSLKITLESE